MIIVYLYTLLYNTGTQIYLRRGKKTFSTITNNNKKNRSGGFGRNAALASMRKWWPRRNVAYLHLPSRPSAIRMQRESKLCSQRSAPYREGTCGWIGRGPLQPPPLSKNPSQWLKSASAAKKWGERSVTRTVHGNGLNGRAAATWCCPPRLGPAAAATAAGLACASSPLSSTAQSPAA